MYGIFRLQRRLNESQGPLRLCPSRFTQAARHCVLPKRKTYLYLRSLVFPFIQNIRRFLERNRLKMHWECSLGHMLQANLKGNPLGDRKQVDFRGTR